MSSRLLFALLVFSALGWPFVIHPRVSSPGLMVLPGATQHVSSTNRGGEDELEYKIVNETTQEYALRVGHRSCKCLDVHVSPEVLVGGGSATVTTRAKVPLAGRSNGAFIIHAEALRDSPGSSKDVVLGFSMCAALEEELGIVPREVRIADGDWTSSRTITLTCNVRSRERPSEVSITEDGEGVPFQTVGGWAAGDEGWYSCLLDVSIPGGDPGATERALNVLVRSDRRRGSEVSLLRGR